jgi:hypothetical protein
MAPVLRIACDQAELVVECAARSETIALAAEPVLVDDVVAKALSWLDDGPVAIAMLSAPSPSALVSLSTRARKSGHAVVLAYLSGDPKIRDLAGDLGIAAVSDVAPLLAALSLVARGVAKPWGASTRGLPEVDRARLGEALATLAQNERQKAQLVRADAGTLALETTDSGTLLLGPPHAAGEALVALARADGPIARPRSILDGVDPAAVLDVIFGPPRALSDPASKAALTPYGVPLPIEELCTSPSRAAAEAQRIGFPVRIALASPDLRVWDHPDLAVDGVDNAARVRDVFRQVMTLATVRAPKARLLGVTVTATTAARALLHVVCTPLPEGLVLVDLAFADSHGVASGDRTITILPAPIARIERALARLVGQKLVLDGTAAERRATIESVADVLLRVAAFVDDRREEIERVEIDPLAVLVGGGAEVREACVTVGDAFLRSLEKGAAG